MNNTYNEYSTDGSLMHYGVKGMKWGIRRYQPYGQGYGGSTGKYIGPKSGLNRQGSSRNSNRSKKKLKLTDKQKKAIKIGAIAAGTALAVYGGYKLSKYLKANKQIVNLAKRAASIDSHERAWYSGKKAAPNYTPFGNQNGVGKKFQDAFNNSAYMDRKNGLFRSDYKKYKKILKSKDPKDVEEARRVLKRISSYGGAGESEQMKNAAKKGFKNRAAFNRAKDLEKAIEKSGPKIINKKTGKVVNDKNFETIKKNSEKLDKLNSELHEQIKNGKIKDARRASELAKNELDSKKILTSLDSYTNKSTSPKLSELQKRRAALEKGIDGDLNKMQKVIDELNDYTNLKSSGINARHKVAGDELSKSLNNIKKNLSDSEKSNKEIEKMLMELKKRNR